MTYKRKNVRKKENYATALEQGKYSDMKPQKNHNRIDTNYDVS